MQSFSYRLKKLEIGLVLLDKSWRITDCDVMARNLLGRPPGTLRGCSILDLHPPSSRQKVEWLLESAAHGPASLIIALPDRTLMVRVVSLDADRSPGAPTSATSMSCSRSMTTRKGWNCFGFWKSSAAEQPSGYPPTPSTTVFGAAAGPASSPGWVNR